MPNVAARCPAAVASAARITSLHPNSVRNAAAALAVSVASAAMAPSQTASAAPNIRVTPEQPAGELVEGERKTVTALFADIKGSTELMEALDPEEARRIIDPTLKLMIDAVHRYDGYIVQSTGDGIFALFGAPVRTKTIRNEHSMRRYQLAGDATRTSSRLREGGDPDRGACRSQYRRGRSTNDRHWPCDTPNTPRLDIRLISHHECRQ